MSTTIAFILGIIAVIIFACIVMGIISFFKVIKLNKKVVELETSINNNIGEVYNSITQLSNDLYGIFSNLEKSTNNNINEVYNQINVNVDDLSKTIEKIKDDIYRTMDSRFNKFENKVDSENKDILNEMNLRFNDFDKRVANQNTEIYRTIDFNRTGVLVKQKGDEQPL